MHEVQVCKCRHCEDAEDFKEVNTVEVQIQLQVQLQVRVQFQV